MLRDARGALGRCQPNANARHDQDRGGRADQSEARWAQPGGEADSSAPGCGHGIGNHALAQTRPGLRRLQFRVERGADFFLELAHQVMTCGTSTAGRNPCAAR